jgi:hypothetical protein
MLPVLRRKTRGVRFCPKQITLLAQQLKTASPGRIIGAGHSNLCLMQS